jgi:two-component system sensor histidine kinase RegB
MLKRPSGPPEAAGPPVSGEEAVLSPAPGRASLDMGVSPTGDATNRKNMALLIQLRWTAVIGQIATIAFVDFWLGIALPLAAMGAVISALVTLNIASMIWVRSRDEIGSRELLIALMLDVIALTIQLYLSGGAANPFTSLYLLQVALSCVSFGWLTISYHPLELPHQMEDPFSLHVAGMFVGFMIDAVLLAIFVTRINRNLRDRDAHLAALRQHAAEQDHIVRMGLLASGAAHELGTPLASLSVILSDWRRMPALTAESDIADDLAEMEAALQRCKTIVTGILVSAGQARGEGSEPTTITAFLTQLVEEWRKARSVSCLQFRNSVGTDLTIVSDVTLKQAIFNVLDNALEVSRDWVELAVERDGDTLVLSVSDRGPGFPPEILAQLGRPYQSSKGRPGSGLGLFLVVNVIRKLGGVVTAENHRKRGATIRLVLPLATLAIGGHFVS